VVIFDVGLIEDNDCDISKSRLFFVPLV